MGSVEVSLVADNGKTYPLTFRKPRPRVVYQILERRFGLLTEMASLTAVTPYGRMGSHYDQIGIIHYSGRIDTVKIVGDLLGGRLQPVEEFLPGTKSSFRLTVHPFLTSVRNDLQLPPGTYDLRIEHNK